MTVAALLLTGGAARRMGCDKAVLTGPDGVGLAVRTARLLATVARPVIEVGPGRSGADAVADDHPGAGPLAAVATGVTALARTGWSGAALVVATDLALLDTATLVRIADHPAAGSVVPVWRGRPQWLCARYDAATLGRAGALVAAGERRMRVLGAGAVLVAEADWSDAARPWSLLDVDTPADLGEAALAAAPPVTAPAPAPAPPHR